MPDDWGNPQEEQRFANETVALIDKNYRAHFAFSGPDRVRYLNAILTNNMKDLAVGQGVISLLLNAQGRILAEIETFADAEKMFCASYRMIHQTLLKVFDKYIIMDDVTLTDESDTFGTLALEGPLAAKITNELTGSDLAMLSPLGWTEILVKSGTSDSSAPIPCRLVKRSGDPASAGEFVVQSKNLEPLWNILQKAAQQHGGGPMGYKALSAQRLVQGTPWFGYDFGEKQIPHEAALESSHISYTKGCYTGQEIVARTQYLGRLKERTFLAHVDGPPSGPGAKLYSPTFGEQSCGTVLNAAAAPGGGSDLVAALQIAAAQCGDVRIGSPDGPELILLPLPYPLPDAPSNAPRGAQAPQGRMA